MEVKDLLRAHAEVAREGYVAIPFGCRVRWHRWEKWAEVAKGPLESARGHRTGTYFIYQRKCAGCGRVESHFTRVTA